MNQDNQVYFVDSGDLSPQALEKKHRIEQDPAARSDHMAYLPGIEVIQSVVKDKVIAHDLLEEGIFVNPVVSPAVAPEDTLIRFSLMATHTKEQVTHALEGIQKGFRKYAIIK